VPWFKVDDALAFNAKFVTLPLAAAGLWLRAGSWCAQQLTDGHLPAGMVPAFGATQAEADALVAAKLWRRVRDGYVFHDWERYQPTSDSVRAEREAAAERMRELRARRKGTRRAEPGPAAEQDVPDQDGSERADDVRPNNSSTFAAPAADEVQAPRPSPSPGPSSVESSRGGEQFRNARGREEPPLRCPQHARTPATGPCGPCGDARREHEAWQRVRREQAPVVGVACPHHPDQSAGRCGPCGRDSVSAPPNWRAAS
jgi:hypothetical protein